MSLENIINGIKKAACVGLVTIALMGGIAREGRTQETNFGYAIIKIEVPGVKWADIGIAINNLGWVVGNSIFSLRPRKTAPFLYRDGITESIIPQQFIDIFGNDFSSEVCAVNDEGKMLINAGVKDEHYVYKHDRGFVYNPNNGELIELPFKGVAMNNRGEVVGKRHLLRNGQVIDISLPPPSPRPPELQVEDLTIYGINDYTQIVGEVILKDVESGENKTYPFVWEQGRMGVEVIHLLWYEDSDLPAFVKEPLYGVAHDISNIVSEGLYSWQHIVGWFGYGYSEDYYFPYNFSCKWVRMSFLTIERGQLDTNYSEAYAVNDKGQSVGKRFKKIGGFIDYRYEPYAVLYKNQKIIELDDFLTGNSGFLHLSEARDINNDGWIIGDGVIRGGYTSSFLAKPLKEPSPDLNKDGIVNLYDLAELSEHWLEER
jgi:uncharacterized membrane protein